MNTTTLELTQEELAVIEAARAVKQKDLDKADAAEAARLESLAIANAKIQAVKQELIDVAPAGMFTVDDKNANVLFYLEGDLNLRVTITERVVYTGSYPWRGDNKGLQYRLYINDTERWYKRPASVVKSVQDQQSAHAEKVAAQARATAKRDMGRDEASAACAALFPEAEISYSEGHDYRSGRRSGGSYQPNLVIATTARGSFSFTYEKVTGEIKLSVYKRCFNNTINDELMALVLGNTMK